VWAGRATMMSTAALQNRCCRRNSHTLHPLLEWLLAQRHQMQTWPAASTSANRPPVQLGWCPAYGYYVLVLANPYTVPLMPRLTRRHPPPYISSSVELEPCQSIWPEHVLHPVTLLQVA
jgi:hypothetical protein